MTRRLRRPSARTVALGDLQDTFLISAVGMVLIIRLQLWATNYPQLGGGKLHIAHLLWGGLLMALSIGALLTFIGRRWRAPAAVVGGAGFGFFIDEVGKFVTSDNDYFFKPSAAIIYITFVCLYFIARATRERRGFSSVEYVANALDVFSDATVHDLDEGEKRQALQLLAQAGDHPLAPALRRMIEEAPVVPARPPSPPARLARAARRRYVEVCGRRWFRRAVVGVVVALAALPVALILLVAAGALAAALGADVTIRLRFTVATTGETIAFLVAAALVWIGVVRIRRGRTLDGYRTFDHALLVEIFVGQVFAFVAHSFAAIWGFLFAVALLVTLRFMIRQERRLAAESAHPPAPTNGPGGPPPREPVVAVAQASQ